MKPTLNIVLLGKKGAGKSAAGNTILGPEAFVSKKSSKLVTRDVVVKSKTLDEVLVNVYDTPGFCDRELSEEEYDQMINEKILQKCESDLCVFLLVVKADSFAEEDRKTVEKIEKLLGKSRLDKTWILFTKGDELQEENMTIKEFLDESEPLKKLVAKYDERYYVFNNKKQCTSQVRMLISKLAQSSLGLNVSASLNIVLLGKKGAGKSAAGNTILGPETFVSKKSSQLVTRDVVVKSKTLFDLQVNVYDTPGFCDTELSEEEFDQMIIEKILQKCESDLFVFLLVIKADSFAEEDRKTVEKIEKLLGKSRLDKTWILFTKGDELQEENMTIEAFLDESEPFKELLAKYDERYHVFNNKKQCTDQVRMLISKFVPISLGLNAMENHQKPCQSAINNDQNVSREKTSSKPMRETGNGSRVAHQIKKNLSEKIEDGSNENLAMFKLRLNETWQNRDGFSRRSTFGNKTITKENKTIMMIGATGAGKTTLINSMINYILGVKWEDDFRFVLIDEGKQKSQAESQTSEITAYQINHMNGFQVPYSLTIVDTPGFGDTRGISHDQKITKQIQEFFSARGGIDRIDAVCFVVQASLARLTHTQKYVFDSILSIFGKDIAQNIIVLITFADGKKPPVLEAIKVSEVPCSTNESGEPLHFKFNNSALFATNNKSADNEEDFENFDQMFWKLGISSMKKFFTSLNMMETQSLSLTQEVLKERQQLEVYVQGLQPQINAGLTKLDEIKKTRGTLEQHKAEMDANKDFEYEIEITVAKPIENTNGHYLTNCQICHFTCHDACVYGNDSDKYKCCAMKDGKCTVCSGKCDWNVHFNQKYKWDYVLEKRTETYQDLKKRYEAAHGQVMSKEKIFEELENEFQVVQGIVAKLIKASQKSLERLQEIALKPNPLSTPDYIDLMIESEKQEAKPGFKDRIQSLMEVRKKAEIISKVSKGEVLPDYWNDHLKQEKQKHRIIMFNNSEESCSIM